MNQGNKKVELADFIKVYEQTELENLDYMERHPKKVAGKFDQHEDEPRSDEEQATKNLNKRKPRKVNTIKVQSQPKI